MGLYQMNLLRFGTDAVVFDADLVGDLTGQSWRVGVGASLMLLWLAAWMIIRATLPPFLNRR